MELWEVAAREAIRTLIARYAHCADGGRFDALASLFAADGVLEIAGREPLVGHDAIRAFLTTTKTTLAAQATRPFVRHHVSSIDIEVAAPDQATAASYFFVINERGPDHWGRYRDELIKVGDGWLFKRRRVRLDGRKSDQ